MLLVTIVDCIYFFIAFLNLSFNISDVVVVGLLLLTSLNLLNEMERFLNLFTDADDDDKPANDVFPIDLLLL